jgi:hypothetical protein
MVTMVTCDHGDNADNGDKVQKADKADNAGNMTMEDLASYEPVIRAPSLVPWGDLHLMVAPAVGHYSLSLSLPVSSSLFHLTSSASLSLLRDMSSG